MARKISFTRKPRFGRLQVIGRNEEGVGSLMTDILKSLESIQLPPGQLKKLGLDKDWVKRLSPEFKERAVRKAIEYRDVLKELSKK